MAESKSVRVDPNFLIAIRQELLTRTKDREDNPLWRSVFGDRLERLSDRRILELACGALIEKVQAAPAGETGLSWFDRPGMV